MTNRQRADGSDVNIVRLSQVGKRFGSVCALDGISATIEEGKITGLVGPDGAGKTTLIRLMTALLSPDSGSVTVFGADSRRDGATIQAEIGYMPQRFGLYEDLSVQENLSLFAALRGLSDNDRETVFAELLSFTDLSAFRARLAGHLSGGMKQKLGLACALLTRPRLLLLDEPSVGVDPISRRELWSMVSRLKEQGASVVWSTAYLDEAEACDRILLLNAGKLLFAGVPQELTHRVAGRVFRIRGGVERRRLLLARALGLRGVIDGVTQGESIRLVTAPGADPKSVADAVAAEGARCEETAPRFEDAFVDLLGGGPGGVSKLAESSVRRPAEDRTPVIEARDLTKKFGSFTAAEAISFQVSRGEIFGLLGPNGAGKSTTFRMLCGLLKPSGGEGRVAGLDLLRDSAHARSRLGYMAQKFSLYGDLTVEQNLNFFAGAYGLAGRRRRERIALMVEIFNFATYLRLSSRELPLGMKQRLALACAVIHDPDVLFLDEPTSGVDPLTRREFWTHINGLVERGVAVLVTTHFMEEAEYCDRISLIYRGRSIAMGSPDELKARVADASKPDPSMEDAFVALVERAHLKEAS